MGQSNNRTRLWIVLDLQANKRGSLEQGLAALAARLQDVHVDATFVFSDPPIEWLRAALDSYGVATRVLNFRKPMEAAFTFARWLRAEPPTLVHFHFVRAHSPLVLMAHAAGARVLVHDHMTLGQAVAGYPEHSERVKSILRPFKRLRGATIGRCVDSRLAVSVFVAASIMDAEFYPSERIEVVANGVDVSRFAGADPAALRAELKIGSRPMVACVSRLSREKGVHILIRAMAKLQHDVVLVIAGGGADTEYCRGLVNELGLADRVFFIGVRSDVENIYAAANVVVMPSLWDEAFGLCVVEAMATGRPVIVTDSGAMPELIGNGECGCVVPKGDEGTLAAAISELITHPAHANRLGAAGKQRALERYPIEKWVDGLLTAYSRHVSMARRKSAVISFEGSNSAERAARTPPPPSGQNSAIG